MSCTFTPQAGHPFRPPGRRASTKSFGDQPRAARGRPGGGARRRRRAASAPRAPARRRSCARSTAWRPRTPAPSRFDDASASTSARCRATRARRREIVALRSRSGMVFQSHNLFPHKTVLQNLIEGPVQVQERNEDEAVADARRLLEQVGLGTVRTSTPRDSRAVSSSASASPAPWRSSPQVVLLDEPTSALDPELVGEVLGVVRDLAQEAGRWSSSPTRSGSPATSPTRCCSSTGEWSPSRAAPRCSPTRSRSARGNSSSGCWKSDGV